MTATPQELLDDPSWFPSDFSQDFQSIRFVKISRSGLSGESFLDQRMQGSVEKECVAKVKDVVARVGDVTNPAPAYIFHTAFCCSTLMARALDRDGVTLALKEPNVLMDLANAFRIDEKTLKNADYSASLVRGVVALLSRPFAESESILVKPTNAANNLLPEIVESGANILLLYGDLRSFLVSVLKKSEACKAFVRQQYNIFALDRYGLGAIPQRQAMGFTDLQVAAVLWRHQMELFERAASSNAGPQIQTLNFREFLASPANCLYRVSRHLGLGHEKTSLEDVANGPVFSSDSKFTDQSFDSGQRALESSTIEERYGDTLDQIISWGEQLNLGTDLAAELSNPLTA